MEISQNRNGPSLDFQVAIAAYNSGDLKFAGEVCENLLSEYPDHADAYSMLSRVLLDNGHVALSRIAAIYAGSLKPTADNLTVMAAAEIHLGRQEIALEYLGEVLKASPNHVAAWRMSAEALVGLHRFDEALEHAEKALTLDPAHEEAKAPKGFSLLHQRKWGEGWDCYAWGMGRQQYRDRHVYLKDGKELPEWDGKKPGRVLVYAEQGLGDQLAYCSALVDPQVSEVVCDPKLATLLQRSLPGSVYGDQFSKDVDWEPRADYALSMSQMMRFRRRTEASFPKTAYLKPRPEKRLMCKALLDSLSDKPKVGIAWTGGRPLAKSFNGRNLTPEDLAPILSLPYDFISIEYRDTEIPDGVRDLGWLHKTKDYDDTAALVDCLDAVVTVPTTAYHLAGGLGVKAFVLVHDKPHFHEGLTGDSPWWGSVEFIRRPELGTAGAVAETATRLEKYIGNLKAGSEPQI